MPLLDVRRSHWVPGPDDTPPLRHLTVGAVLDEAAEAWPDREAIVYSAYDDLGIAARWTFGELQQRALAVARAFAASGIEPGSRIAVWATNRPEWVEVQFGAAYAGVILVPLNPLYRAEEVRYVLGKTEAAACFVEPENRGASLWEILAEAAADVPSLELRVAFGDAPDAGGPSLAEWVDAGRSASEDVVERRRRAVRPEDTSQIQFTSGTTGFPKGAELRHGGLTDNARLFAQRAEFHLGGRHCNPMPFFHCGGCVMATIGCVATGSAQLPTLTFDAARMARTIDGEQATSAGAVPTMLIGLEEEVDRAGGSLESLDVVVTGGAPVPVDVERRWIERFGVRFTITYGMTEASPVVTQSLPDDPEELQIATCGPPLPHVEVDVVDVTTREPVPLGEQGELRTRGFLVMKGYWREPEATARAIEEGGWLGSGDLARMDADGYISITGRAKEMIIRGGENVYPAEIEDALRRLPGVADASVVGVPDERYGEQVAAFVRLGEGATMTPEELRSQLTDRVARYKVPRYITIVDEYPTTPSGKVQKFKLLEQFEAARARGSSAA
ncbi:MAG: fatty-acyl-CoA synthase [Solirubrobacteraceae bacterium]|nr:fatty-acyl-CoA synthase [Solirubrobacteraceae bacterium]